MEEQAIGDSMKWWAKIAGGNTTRLMSYAMFLDENLWR
jgi:hypothetical protein